MTTSEIASAQEIAAPTELAACVHPTKGYDAKGAVETEKASRTWKEVVEI